MQSCAQCRSCATRNQHLRNLQSPIVHSFVLAGDNGCTANFSRDFAHLSRPFLEKNNVLIKETIICISIKTAIVVSYTSDNLLVYIHGRMTKRCFKRLIQKCNWLKLATVQDALGAFDGH